LRELLLGRGHELAEVDEALERLEAIGELDDARFARRYAEDKRELRGWGPERIREALGSRGVPSELIEAALGADDHGGQVERAVALLRGRNQDLDDERGRGRALAYLTRRGYDYELAYEAIRVASG
jgi:regulatory protein